MKRFTILAAVAVALVMCLQLPGCKTDSKSSSVPKPTTAEIYAGIPSRQSWTASHVQGTPDAPDAFMLKPAFPQLKFKKPLEIAFEPAGNRVVVVEHGNLLYSFVNDPSTSKADLLLDVSKLPCLAEFPNSNGLETLGFAFDPAYSENHFCYICYHPNYPWLPPAEYAAAHPENATATHVSRFMISRTDPPTIDPKSEQILLRWPGNGHNGGCLKFGPDSCLYISTGDSGNPNPPDPFKVGQNIGDLRAKILRIDVRQPSGSLPYTIPVGNPFVNTPGARGEVYAYGLRNPWRFSFDRVTGECWCGDVGWELWESVQHIVPGGNYGWSITEGPQRVYPDEKPGPTPIIPPAIALPHTEAASLTGGYVYHGKKLPELQNQYLFGDWETRRLWAAPVEGGKLKKYRTLAQTDLRIVSFGEDADGEIYIVDYEGGKIWQIVSNPQSGSAPKFPTKLGETGLFEDVASQKPNPGVIEFQINTPQWLDGSTSRHFIALPGEDPVSQDYARTFTYPAGTVLARTIWLNAAGPAGDTPRNVETQLLHFDGRQWHAYAYQWNDEQTDAVLVDGEGRDVPVTVADAAAPDAKRRQIWHFNSRAQCMTCHTSWTNHAIAFTSPQLDRTIRIARGSGSNDTLAVDQLGLFQHTKLLLPPTPAPIPEDGSPPPEVPPKTILVNPYSESTGTLGQRARSYLAVNCAVCHRFGGGGTAMIDLVPERELKDMHLFTPPMLGTFNLHDAQVVCPGNPAKSVLFYRMAKSGTGRMPHLGSTLLDEQGLNLIGQWIASLPRSQDKATPDEAARDAAVSHLQSSDAITADADITLLLSTTDGALKLLAAMNEGRVAEKYRAAIVTRAAASPADTVRDLFASFVPESANAVPKLGTSPDVATLLALPGDAKRGGKVFFETAGGLCSRCHIVGKEGTDFGPNLSQIGVKYNRADMLDNILHPSKTIAPGFETYVIRTKSGQSYIGLLVSKTDGQVMLKDQQRNLIKVQNSDIDKMVVQSISAMPEGIIADLEPQQAADLLEYLVSRK